MARKKKYTVLANLDTSSPSIEQDGNCPFRINVRISGKVKPYLTGFAHMHRKFWVPELKEDGTKSKKMRVKDAKGNDDAKALIRLVVLEEKLVLDVLQGIEEAKDPITHTILNDKLAGTQAQTLVEFCEWRKNRTLKNQRLGCGMHVFNPSHCSIPK